MSNKATEKKTEKKLPRHPLMPWKRRKPMAVVLHMTGTISAGGSPFQSALSMSSVSEELEQAFSFGNAKAVAIVLNSPGGSPVQSHLIYKEIRRLSEKEEIPVYMFAEDVAASGGYFIALAGDEIYADEASIVGSIGVVSAGFGFDKAIKKIGVDRRVITSGNSKAILDPFQPQKKDDVEKLKAVQVVVHEHFKNIVKQRRGDKLAADDETLFNGAFWTGTQAKEHGLIDGIGDYRTILREKFGDEIKIKTIGGNKSWLRKRKLFSSLNFMNLMRSSSPVNWADDLISALERRSIWSRFGL